MLVDKLKYVQGYVKVRLTGYAPERFLNLCSNHDILIWNLEYREDNYEFCLSVKGFRHLKPVLKKTKTRLTVLERHGLPFLLHRYRKRKLFFGGIVFCAAALYIMSLFIWNIEIDGNLHRTDSAIVKFLEENEVYHGVLKSRLDCEQLEQLLRSQYDDVIWASVKIQGTRLVIDLQENLATNNTDPVSEDDTPSDLVADKEAEIYSIYTRNGTPYVEKGIKVAPGDMLVEGKLPIYNDSAEIANYQYCRADADILGVTNYSYEDQFSLEYEDKAFTGREKNSYSVQLFQKQLRLPFGANHFQDCDVITEEYPLKLGKNFYLPVVLCKEVSKEYNREKKTYTKEEAKALANQKLEEFCKKLTQKGIQIIENNVMIVTDETGCRAKGEIKVIEPIGKRQTTTITEIQQEGQMTDESDGDGN